MLPLAWVVALALSRAYEPRFLGVGSEEFRRVGLAAVGLVSVTATLFWAFRIDLASGPLGIALPLMATLTLLQRHVVRRRLHLLRAQGRCTSRLLVVGHANSIASMVRQLRSSSYHGLLVVSACTPDSTDHEDLRALGLRVEGGFCDIAAVVKSIRADAVAVLACPELDGTFMRRLGWDLEGTDTRLMVAPSLTETIGPRLSIQPVCGLPLLSVEAPELSGIRRILKGVLDRALAAAAVLVAAPLLLALALAIYVDNPGPILYRQRRIGRQGQEFTMLKFRSMVPEADDLRSRLHGEHDGNEVLFKLRRDPRITRLGRLLRRYSLDELPQLFNVLLGQMSLVGPRPPLPEEVSAYPAHVRRRFMVKPGLTGLWQINGRSDLDWEESVRLDLRYVENWSLAFDLLILWRTFAAVVRGQGAY